MRKMTSISLEEEILPESESELAAEELLTCGLGSSKSEVLFSVICATKLL